VRQLMIHSGRQGRAVEPLDISRMVEGMLKPLRASISKLAVLETNLAKDLPPIHANADQMRQVVTNLIISASDAVTDRSGVIRISTRRRPAGRDPNAGVARASGYVELDVTGPGTGLPVGGQDRIFDPFFTATAVGHRLGLAVVQGIVRSLHGEIHFDSRLGKGTTFQILLPIVDAPEDRELERSDWPAAS
jgi:two-component system, cell cycle sensor histidine kinase and response regulator CckA